MSMPMWRRNLIVCWFGMFVTSVGMSQLAPVLPLYIRQLGVGRTDLIEQYSGIAFGITFIVSAVFSPVWGYAADRVGRKPMLLRASLGMAIVLFCMGFVRDVYQLIELRFLQGAITGYTTACITLIATQTDKEHAGWALGTLSTSSIVGSLLGPMIGGYIAESLGLPYIFFITGGLLMVAFLTTLFFVKETFVRPSEKTPGATQVWQSIPHKRLTVTVFATYFMLMLGLYSIEPIVTIYVSQLSADAQHVALVSGLVFSASGLANILAAPRLGKISDKIGPQKVMLVALVAAGIIFIPQAFVSDPWQLLALRFLLGLATAGLNPSVNTLIKRLTPDELAGRVFGFSMSAAYLGAFAGASMGGEIASIFGMRYVFFTTSALMLANAALVYFSIYRKLNRTA